MCGFAGVWDPTAAIPAMDQQQLVQAMNATLQHRGPDNESTWTNQAGLYLAHSRLSIHDLSSDANQPMHDASGRFSIVFNGEIYNYRELRQELNNAGVSLRTDCDTEVLLAAVSHWGLNPALERFNGMYAFALWDAQQNTLSLVRDRAGKKPLYYGVFAGQLLFASELKALRSHPACRTEIEPRAVSAYLQHSFIPGNQSIYKNIHKLGAGTQITLQPQHLTNSTDVRGRSQAHWDPVGVYSERSLNPVTLDETAALHELDTRLREAVRLRLDADVPVGILLSGGVDSSLVAGAAQTQSSTAINTFSVGFDDYNQSETAAALKIAQHLGCNHNELRMSSADALAVVPSLPLIYDEPFSDTSQIPTYLICKQAREKVTVALSGDGGDELFFGYKHYWSSDKLWQQIRKLGPARKGLGHLLSTLGHIIPGDSRLVSHGQALRAAQLVDLDAARRQSIHIPNQLLLQDSYHDRELLERIDRTQTATPQDKMMLLDFCNNLCDDILVKTDRASMANSLELRSPLLDQNIVEYAWRLPLSLKYRDGRGKYLLRRLLDQYIPPELTDRPKQGFGAPVKIWLNGSLRDWAEDLLEPKRVRRQGIFDADQITRIWTKTKGATRGHSKIWTILMFQAWYEQHME
jgi:asparagine synthase (glutamine-hydrolysing)